MGKVIINISIKLIKDLKVFLSLTIAKIISDTYDILFIYFSFPFLNKTLFYSMID